MDVAAHVEACHLCYSCFVATIKMRLASMIPNWLWPAFYALSVRVGEIHLPASVKAANTFRRPSLAPIDTFGITRVADDAPARGHLRFEAQLRFGAYGRSCSITSMRRGCM